MQNPNSVITQAFEGLVLDVSHELAISDKRVYEMLSRDNPYPKIWRLLNALGRINPERLRLVQSDFNARCTRILGNDKSPAALASLHKETSEAIQIVIENGEKINAKKKFWKRLRNCKNNLNCAIPNISPKGVIGGKINVRNKKN